MPHISPTLRGQCKKLKFGTFTRLYPSHVRGLAAWLKPTGKLYFLGESSPEQKADAWDIRTRRVPEAFYRVPILEGADSPPTWSQRFGSFAENGFRAFHRAKMSSENTQHKHNKLHFSSKNQIEKPTPTSTHYSIGLIIKFCLIWFFTSHQQSFTYVGTGFMGWTSTNLGWMWFA